MTIIFAENFQQDVGTTIMNRYPGTTRVAGSPDVPNAFPVNSQSILQFGTTPFGPSNDRFEVRLEFVEGDVQSSGHTGYHIFGLELTTYANAIDVDGYRFDTPGTIESMNWIVERRDTRFRLIVLINDVVVLNPSILSGWTPTSWIGALWNSNLNWIRGLPQHLSGIAVAVDTPPKTYLGQVEWIKRQLSVVSSGDWVYSDQGYVQDTDKSDPTVEQPFIENEELSAIEFELADEVEGADVTNLYVNVVTDLPEIVLDVNGHLDPASQTLRPSMVLPIEGTSVRLETVESVGPSNSDGVQFLGDRADIITYSDLSSALSFSPGTLNTADGGNRWLEFIIDGRRLLVSKVSARYLVSWEQIYQAGLVYGTDDYGLSPSGTPTLQLRTVEIGGTVYKVRLLKGADYDPPRYASSDDPVGFQRSEWSRIFSTITPWTGYNDRILANYTAGQLGMGGGVSGRGSWVQEQASSVNNRVFRGFGSPLSVNSAAATTSTNAAYGWRPVLEAL